MNVNILVVRLSHIIQDEQICSRICSPEWPCPERSYAGMRRDSPPAGRGNLRNDNAEASRRG
jgi:hypothetical protein